MLPWFSNARDQLGIADCGKCKASTPRLVRQSMGCGFETPPPTGMPVNPWDSTGREPYAGELDEHGQQRLKICPGYVCNLPEVIEVARARLHWSKGALPMFTDGVRSERLMHGIEILESSANELQRYEIKKAHEKE